MKHFDTKTRNQITLIVTLSLAQLVFLFIISAGAKVGGPPVVPCYSWLVHRCLLGG